MPSWLLIVIGLVAGLGLVYGILWICFRLERRPGKRKSRLAEPSGQWDSGSGLQGGVDPGP